MGDLLTPLLAAATASAFFARGFARARRRPRARPGWDRPLLFAAGVLAGLLGLGLLEAPAERLLSAHMAQHLLIGDVAPAAILVALRGTLFQLAVPSVVRRTLWTSRFARTVLRPGPSLALWAASLWLWHVPAVYGAAVGNPLLHELQHASFVLGGFLVWNQLIDPGRRRVLGLWPSLGFALAMMAAAQVIVMALVLSYRPFYGVYASQPDRLWGLSPLADQDAAALAMAVEQFLLLGTYTLIRLREYARGDLTLREGHPLGT